MENSNEKVAFIISGAAAFIPQELACIRAIMEGTYPGATHKVTPVVLAGTSSGSICTVLVNGIMDGKITWDQLENEILPNIKNGDVYNDDILQQSILYNAYVAFIEGKKAVVEGEALFQRVMALVKDYQEGKWGQVIEDLAGIFGAGIEEYSDLKAFFKTAKNLWDKLSHLKVTLANLKQAYEDLFNNLKSGYILDTTPLVGTMKKYINGTMGYTNMGELGTHTYISAVQVAGGAEKRFNSIGDDANTDLVDIVLASTAIPVVFPQREVNNAWFVDGGTGPDNIPVLDVISSGEKFDAVYTITYMHNSFLGKPIEHHYTHIPLLSNLLFAIAVVGENTAPFQLAQTLMLVDNPDNAFFYMPTFEETFSALDFDSMPEQLKVSAAYCAKNPPRLVTDVLKSINFPVNVSEPMSAQ